MYTGYRYICVPDTVTNLTRSSNISKSYLAPVFTVQLQEEESFWLSVSQAPLRRLHLAGLRLTLLPQLAQLRLRHLALGRASADALVTEDLEALLELAKQEVRLESLGIYGLSGVASD